MSVKSQGSQAPASPSLVEFFSEVELMKLSACAIEPSSNQNDLVESIQDDTEKATDFLSSLGLSFMPSHSATDLDTYKNLQDILTEGQVATIRRRVDTVRSKKKTAARTDVRSIFLPDDDDDDHDNNNNNNNHNNPQHGDNKNKQKYDTSLLAGHRTEEEEEEEEAGGVDNGRVMRGLMEKVMEEKEVEVKESKVYSVNPTARMSKKEEAGLFALPSIFGRQDHPDCMPPTPTLCPDKIDRSIALEVTHLEDLGAKDRSMLEALAHIELLRVFDSFKLDVLKRKSRKKTKHEKEGVFGVGLEKLVERDNEAGEGNKVPKFLKELLAYMEANFLDKEGILRLSGSFNRIKELRDSIDATWYTQYSHPSSSHPSSILPSSIHPSSIHPSSIHLSSTHPSIGTLIPASILLHPTTYSNTPSHSTTSISPTTTTTTTISPPTSFSSLFNGMRANDAVGLLKLFLRDLPSPLLTLQWIDSFVQVAKMPNVCMQCYSISLLMQLLPGPNRNTLKLLLSFLKRVASHSDVNKMTEESVSMIIAPNLFLLPASLNHPSTGAGGGVGGGTLDRDLGVATSCTTVIQLMLKHLNEIFIVPAGLINQIRQKNHQDRKKKQKFWGKREKHNLPKAGLNINISVHLEPYPDHVSFRPKRHSTVADVIISVVMHSKSRPNIASAQEILQNFSMYEIGGNIGERRLENSTMLNNIMTVNPGASYVIRPLPPASPATHPITFNQPL